MFGSLYAAWFKSAMSILEMGQASMITVGYRLPMLAGSPFLPVTDVMRESQRMVVEKVAASYDGTTAAIRETGLLIGRVLMGKILAPTDFAAGAFTIADAAVSPARRTVKANAKRLSRQRR